MNLTDVQDYEAIRIEPFQVPGSRYSVEIHPVFGRLRLIDETATEKAQEMLVGKVINRASALELAAWLVENYPE